MLAIKHIVGQNYVRYRREMCLGMITMAIMFFLSNFLMCLKAILSQNIYWSWSEYL